MEVVHGKTSRIADVAVAFSLGVLIALDLLIMPLSFDPFSIPEAAPVLFIVGIIGALPAVVASVAFARWRMAGVGRTRGRDSGAVLLISTIAALTLLSGLPARARHAMAAGRMDEIAERAIATGNGDRHTVTSHPTALGWAESTGFQLLSCASPGSAFPEPPPTHDPGVSFAISGGGSDQLLYCRHHDDPGLELPNDIEAGRGPAIQHLSGHWYVITNEFFGCPGGDGCPDPSI